MRLSENRGSTPVLLTPPHLSLRPQFFVQLFKVLQQTTTRACRIDCLRRVATPTSLVSDSLAQFSISRLNRHLDAALGDSGDEPWVRITASISRPGGVDRDLVIGWCEQPLPLPAWTTAIRIGDTPHGETRTNS